VSESRAVTLLYGFLSAMWWSKMLHASPSKTFRSRSKMPLKDHRSHGKIVMFQFSVVSEGWMKRVLSEAKPSRFMFCAQDCYRCHQKIDVSFIFSIVKRYSRTTFCGQFSSRLLFRASLACFDLHLRRIDEAGQLPASI
jgi:hypothetical protein